MKYIFTILTLIFASTNSHASGSFSTIFGSEGSTSIKNSKARSLSYSLQYITLSGAIGFSIKQLYDTGFLEPFGLNAEKNLKISPLAYDKSKTFNKTSSFLRTNKQEINRINEIMSARKFKINNTPTTQSIRNQSLTSIDSSIFNKEKRDFLIQSYYENN
tara:strand:- start:1502 stop:1981 length:480 start_codon:yes stop_codon:yes gene_type:complete